MRAPVYLLALAIAVATAVMVARAIAGAISGRGGSRSELARLREQVDHHAAALEDAEATLSNQTAQLAELQERLDFTERLLANGRDRSALETGDRRGTES